MLKHKIERMGPTNKKQLHHFAKKAWLLIKDKAVSRCIARLKLVMRSVKRSDGTNIPSVLGRRRKVVNYAINFDDEYNEDDLWK